MSTFTSMNPLMMNKVRALPEELPTLTAFIRLFSSVNPLMLNKIRTSTKEFATLAAHVRAFTSVNSLMFDETGAAPCLQKQQEPTCSHCRASQGCWPPSWGRALQKAPLPIYPGPPSPGSTSSLLPLTRAGNSSANLTRCP